MARAFLVFCVVLIAGCVPRGALLVVPQTDPATTQQTVFVATDRGVDPKTGAFGGERSDTLHLGRYQVSIPPEHEPGKIEWPRGTPDPRQHMLTTEETIFEDGPAFKAGLQKAFQTLPRGQRDAVVFVHGFNTNFAEGLYRMAQMAHDYRLPGVVVHYSWPSAAHPLGYAHDRDSALFARDGLADLLTRLRHAGAERILLTAHSMGALLTMETLRQTAIARDQATFDSLDGVVLVSPDIDVDLFLSQARRTDPLPQPFVIFTALLHKS